jgi:hypothetical protein
VDSSHTPLNGNVTPDTNGPPGSADATNAFPITGTNTDVTNAAANTTPVRRARNR